MPSYYVSTSGNNTNAGTLAAPWATLSYALTTSVVVAGDTIFVRGGTFNDTVVPTFNGTDTTSTGRINVQNYQNETVWIQPSSNQQGFAIDFRNINNHFWSGIGIDGINGNSSGEPCMTVNGSSNLRYANATIRDASWSGILISQSLGDGSSCVFSSLVISTGGRIGAGGPAAHGIYFTASSARTTGFNHQHVVEDCEITGYTALSNDAGIQLFSDGVQEPDRLNGITIRRNLIRGNSVGMFIDGSSSTAPVVIINNVFRQITNDVIDLFQTLTGPVVYHNTIHANGGVGISVGTNDVVRNALIRNNAITNNGSNPVYVRQASTSSYALIQFNGFSANGGGNTVSDSNGLSTIASNSTSPPSYQDGSTSSTDLRLLSTSLYIDAGTTVVASTVTDDFLRNPRGSSFDLGAYEFQAQGSPSPLPQNQYPAWQITIINIGGAACR